MSTPPKVTPQEALDMAQRIVSRGCVCCIAIQMIVDEEHQPTAMIEGADHDLCSSVDATALAGLMYTHATAISSIILHAGHPDDLGPSLSVVDEQEE